VGTTFKHSKATYTCRALTQRQQQDAINASVDLLQLYHQAKDIPYDQGNENSLRAYKFTLVNKATEFVHWYYSTDIEGEPAHPVPSSTLDLLDINLFEQWVRAMDRAVDLHEQWEQAYMEANKTEASPLASSADKPPASDSTKSPKREPR